MGFFKNDIWLETFRMLIFDIAETLVEMCRDTTIHCCIRLNDEGKVDLEEYWKEANETVRQQVQEAAPKSTGKALVDPIIQREEDEEPIVFGGDHEVSKCASECEEAEGRHGGSEERHETRNAPNSLPSLSESSGADSLG